MNKRDKAKLAKIEEAFYLGLHTMREALNELGQVLGYNGDFKEDTDC